MTDVLNNITTTVILVGCAVLLVSVMCVIFVAIRYYIREYAKPVSQEERAKREERDKGH